MAESHWSLRHLGYIWQFVLKIWLLEARKMNQRMNVGEFEEVGWKTATQVDVVKLTWRGRKGIWETLNRAGYFRNCWSTGMFTNNHLQGLQTMDRNILLTQGGQRRLGKLVLDDRKATVTKITTGHMDGTANRKKKKHIWILYIYVYNVYISVKSEYFYSSQC